MLKVIKPYRIAMVQQDGRRDVLYSWSLTDAMQWISKAFNSDAVTISKYRKVIAYRSPVSLQSYAVKG